MKALDQRNEEIARLYADGMRQIDIAAKFGIEQAEISRLVARAAMKGTGALRRPPEGMTLRCAVAIHKATLLWPCDDTADELRAERDNILNAPGIGRWTTKSLDAWLAKVTTPNAKKAPPAD